MMPRRPRHLRLASVNGEPVELRNLRQAQEQCKHVRDYPIARAAYVLDRAQLEWFMGFATLREQLSKLLHEGADLPVHFSPYLQPKTMVIVLSNGRTLVLTEKTPEPEPPPQGGIAS